MSIPDRISYAKMKERHKEKFLPWYKKRWGKVVVVLLLILFIFLIIASFYFFKKVREYRVEIYEQARQAAINNHASLIAGNNDNYFLGAAKNIDDSSVLTVTNFHNLSCHYSASIYPTIQTIVAKYPNKVRFIFRDYPDQNSIILALGARCAGEQGKYWEMYDLITNLQEDLSLVVDETEQKNILIEMASVNELNLNNFNACLEDKKYLGRIKKDYEDGEALGIKGTPTWFINGVEITSGLNESDFDLLMAGLGYND